MQDNKSPRALSFWSWNESMDENEIKEQIKHFAQRGFGGFIIHSRAGLKIKYMGPEWFQACKIAVEQAKRYDLSVWIYDEDGWPSGFAGGIIPALGEDYQYKGLRFCFGRPDVPEKRILSAYETHGNKYKRIAISKAGSSCLFFYYTVEKHYVDLLYHDTVKKFIENIHEIYKKNLGEYFGSVIKGLFTDEPRMHHELHWCFALPEQYKKAVNKDLLNDLWMLAVDVTGCCSFRHDFWKVLSQMFTTRFVMPLFEWCDANNLIFTGHFAAEDGLCSQVPCNGNIMANYEFMHQPGIDHLGRRNASPVLMKQAASIAHQLGYPNVLSEAFGCSGWDISFADMAHIWGWQASMGINLPCLHLSAYSIKGVRKRDYPAFFSYQEPWWDGFGSMTGWLNGLNMLMSKGKRTTDVLLISPVSSIWCLYGANQSLTAGNISNGYRLTIENLLSVQIDFDLGDEQLLYQYGTVTEGKVHLKQASYSIVILPGNISIEKSTAKLLCEFVQQGGKLIFVNNKPSLIEGRQSDWTDKVNALESAVIANRRELWGKYFDFIKYQRVAEVRSKDGRYLCPDLVLYTKQENNLIRVFIWNGSKGASEFEYLFVVHGKHRIFRVEAENGQKTELEVFYDDEKTYAYFQICDKSSIIFECTAGQSQFIKDKICKTEYIHYCSVSICDKNSLLVDYGSYSVNGSPYSDLMPVIRMQKEIYEKTGALNRGADVIIRYSFESYLNDVKRNDIFLVLEDEHVHALKINGYDIELKRSGWWIDKGFRKYDISEYLKSGSNEVSVRYMLPEFSNTYSGAELFETEANRFFYPVEFENIYILGGFDVVSNGEIIKKPDHYRINNAHFGLMPPSEKANTDLTVQHLWFYRGSAVYRFMLHQAPDSQKIFLILKNPQCTYAEVFVNGKPAGQFIVPPYKTEITNYLTQSENEISIKIYGHNRNLLGPHHHIKGQSYFVGPNIFKGQKGYEDFVTPDIQSENTWTDSYSFVEFNAGSLCLEYYEKTTINPL